MESQTKTAGKAGLLYLIVAIFGGFAHFASRLQLIVPNNSSATVQNIRDSESLFRIGFIADLIQLSCFVFLVLILYKLLKSVQKDYARTMLVIALIGVPIAAINMVHQFAVLLLLNNPEYMVLLEENQLNALAGLFLEFHNIGYAIAHIFFGLWLFPLGYLVYQSGFLPRFLGILLMLATFGYTIHMLTGFLWPNYNTITSWGALFSGFIEILFCLWLLVKGVRFSSKINSQSV